LLEGLSDLAQACADLYRFEEAETLYRQLIADSKRALGATHPQTLQAMKDLAAWMQDVGHDPAAAIEPLRQRMEGMIAAKGENSAAAADAIATLAFNLLKAKQYDEAEKYFRRALAVPPASWTDQGRRASCLWRLAQLRTARQSYSEAEALWLELWEITATQPDEVASGPAVPVIGREIAAFYRTWGHREQAEIWERRIPAESPKKTRDIRFGPTIAAITQSTTRPGITQSEVATLVGSRGRLYTRSGRFDEALVDFTNSNELEPSYILNSYYRAVLLAYLGKDREYREHCEAMLKRFGGPEQGVTTAKRTAKSCLLLPGVSNGARLLAMTELASQDSQPSAGGKSWYPLTKSLALYRLDRFEDCIEWAEKCIAADPDFAHRTSASLLLQSMSLLHLGRAAAAKAAFDRAAEIIKKDLPKAGEEDLADDRIDWLTAHILRREAERLLKRPSSAAVHGER
jgi:tetratricopeptide (TPR) repeat protein